MRTSIRVYKRDEKRIFRYQYLVDMAIGRYGRYELVADGYALTKALAQKKAESKAAKFLKRHYRSQPVYKSVNL